MKKIFFIITFTWLTINAKAQNPGYFNRKNVVEFTAIGQYPFFSNVQAMYGETREFNKVKNDQFKPYRDRFDWGFRIAFNHTFKRNFGAGIEFGYDYFSVQRESRMIINNFLYSEYFFEKVDAASMMIMPKLEFSNRGSVLPMGITHQIGIGIRLVKPVNKTYQYALYEYGSAFEIPDEFAYKGGTVKGVTFMYAVNVRTPLTKSLFLNYGIRYTANFMGNPRYVIPTTYDGGATLEMTQDEFQSLVRRRKQLSLIQASIGLSFAF